MTDRLDIFSFYDEAQPDDRVLLHFADGETLGPARIDGAFLGVGEVHVTLSNGDRMKLREGDRVEIISRSRRSR